MDYNITQAETSEQEYFFSPIEQEKETQEPRPRLPNVKIPSIEGPIGGAEISTHLLYSPHLPITLLSPIQVTDDLTQQTVKNTTEENTELKEESPTALTIDGVHYNNRGYEICGALNQHSKPCQRIGQCPFHKKDDDKSKVLKADRDKKGKIPVKRGPYKRGWTKDEHILFLNGLQIHGKGAWKEISALVKTRSPTQIQSHAQKYFLRQKQEVKNKRSIHDISLEDINTDIVPTDTAPKNTRTPPPFPGWNQSIVQFPQEQYYLNPHPIYSQVPTFLPYGSGWLPQMPYPFGLTLGNPVAPEEQRNQVCVELPENNHMIDPTEQVLSIKNPDEFSSLTQKRSYDSFSFHNYTQSYEDQNRNHTNKWI